MRQHKQRDAIFLPSGFIFNLNVLLWLYRLTEVTAWGPHVTPPTGRLYNNWQSINPNHIFFFSCCMFSELHSNSNGPRGAPCFSAIFIRQVLKVWTSAVNLWRWKRQLSLLGFVPARGWARGVSQTDNFDNLRWIETKKWKYKSLRNIYFGWNGTFRRREAIAALRLEWNM